jgi:pSer/pThr/pTyr-binding forkhead associated (FHA) protein
VRASLFGAGRFQRREDDTQPAEREALLTRARGELPGPGQYLVYEDSGEPCVVALEREWTRVGRSLAADIRFDDPTVSRRHALIVRQPDGVRVLDDRSLNGVFVNSERVEWRALADGDEILVGRYRLHFMDTASRPAALEAAAPPAEATG